MQATGIEAIGWAEEAARRGGGELIVTSIDADGGRRGYDLELIERIRARVRVPVIASGGAGGAADIVAALRGRRRRGARRLDLPRRRDDPRRRQAGGGGVRPAGAGVTVAEGALLPCVVQDADTGRVLMLAHVDAEAMEATKRTGLAHFHSRSRDRLWQKGETSGNVLRVVEIRADCDGDAMPILAHPAGPACHTGAVSCFGDAAPVLAELRRRDRRAGASRAGRVLRRRPARGRRASAPSARWARRRSRCCWPSRRASTWSAEVADLWFHSMLLLARDGLDPLAPLRELRRRRNAPRREA